MNLGPGSVGRIFCHNYFLNRGIFSTETVEWVARAALRPEISCAEEHGFLGMTGGHVCVWTCGPVMRLEGHCSRGVCSLLSYPQQQGPHGDPRGRLTAKNQCIYRLRVSLTGFWRGKCFCMVGGRDGCGQMKKCS